MAGAVSKTNVPFSEFEKTCEMLDISSADLSELLGFTRNWAAHSRHRGWIPKAVSLALQALLAAHGKQLPAPPEPPKTARTLICVVIMGRDNAVAVERMLTMAGQKSYVIQLDKGE